MEIQKRCKYCGGTFIAHKMTTIYCSPSCNNKDYKQKIREKQIAEYQSKNPDTIPVIKKSPLNLLLLAVTGGQCSKYCVLGIANPIYLSYLCSRNQER